VTSDGTSEAVRPARNTGMSMVAWSVPDDLADEKVALRAWRGDDAEWLYEGFNSAQVTAQTEQADGLRVDSVQTAYEMVFEAARRARRGEGIGLAICRATDHEPVGSLELDAFMDRDGEAVIGFWVLDGCRRHGYARAAIQLAASWALKQLEMARVWADVDASNTGSLALLRSIGFGEPGNAELPALIPARATSVVLCLTDVA
jgi:diamine N-acetyltransferase